MRPLTLSAVLALGVLGCSSSSQSAGAAADAGAESDIVGCNGNPSGTYPLETYSSGMGQMGEGKVFRFILEDASPPPVSTSMPTEVWTLRLVDASGHAVTDATFPVMHPWMPQHKHGTSTVTVTNNHDGTYSLNPMYLFMVGIWEIDITAQSGTTKDSTSFFFCLN